MKRRFALFICLLAFLHGCGGGGTTPKAGFTLTGKILLASGAPLQGSTVGIYRTTYTATQIFGLWGTKDPYGNETVKTENTPFQNSVTAADGSFIFSGIPAGEYTVKPLQSSSYMYKSASVPVTDNSGVISITENGTAYRYKPEGSGNQVTADSKLGQIIFQSQSTLTASTLSGLDFEASPPGGV